MENIASKTVAEVVAENIKTADVFKKNGIDFCCGGGVAVVKICQKKDIDFDQLEKELQNAGRTINRSQDYNSWSLDFLIDYIVNTHHTYVTEAIPLILQYSNRVAEVHGHHYKEVVEINLLFHEVAEELSAHLKKEEQILFPFVKSIVKANKEGYSIPQPSFGTVGNPIKMMEMEHETAGDIFKKIRELSNDYTPPVEACNTYRALYAKLEEFEEDLHQHIHLENNILFPKALLLE